MTFFGSQDLVAKYRDNSRRSLDSNATALANGNTLLRRSLEHWFEAENIHPRVVANFEDSALTRVFGQESDGILCGP